MNTRQLNESDRRKIMKDYLKLSPAELKAKIDSGESNPIIFTAYVIRKFMERYHIRNPESAVEQFLVFKKHQSEILFLNSAEQEKIEGIFNGGVELHSLNNRQKKEE